MKWDAMDLENAIAEAGLCGAMVRTPEEWDASRAGPHAGRPPGGEVIKIADSPPEPLPKGGEAPLAGVRVLDLTRVLAGPTCARTLAQYGADVLYVAGPGLPFAAAFVADTSHGKLSCLLDLREDEGARPCATWSRTPTSSAKASASARWSGWVLGRCSSRRFGPV